MNRYIVVGEADGNKVNIYKDQRSFASKRTAQKHLEAIQFARTGHFSIETVERKDDTDKLLIEALKLNLKIAIKGLSAVSRFVDAETGEPNTQALLAQDTLQLMQNPVPRKAGK